MSTDEVTYLVEIEGYNPSTYQTETLYFSTGKGFTTAPSDTPPSTVYYPRVKQAGSIKCDMFPGGGTIGKGAVAYGEIILVNADGELDYLKNWGFDGRKITVKIGYFGDLVTAYSVLYESTMQQIKPERDQVSFAIRGKEFILQRPIQDLKFQGNNVLPSGVEGVATDIMGKPKPIAVGKLFNISPVCVNTSKLVYAANVRHGGKFDAEPNVDAISDFDASNIIVNISSMTHFANVYDKGSPLTFSNSSYDTVDDLLANTPAPGTFDVCTYEGYFRLGSAPSGTITSDVIDGDSYVKGRARLGSLVKQVLNLVSVTDDLINLDDITTIDNSFYWDDAGVYIDSEETASSVLDKLLGIGGIWAGFDRLGIFRMKQIVFPLVDFNLTLDESIVENNFEFLGNADTPNGVPVKRVNIQYKKNYTVQKESELAGGVDPDRRNQLRQEYLTSFDENLEILNPHPLAGELNFTSAFYTDQTTEATKKLFIYSALRDRLTVVLKMRPGLEDLLNLGDNVKLILSRYGYQNGLVRKIISYDLNCASNELTLTLWG